MVTEKTSSMSPNYYKRNSVCSKIFKMNIIAVETPPGNKFVDPDSYFSIYKPERFKKECNYFLHILS